MFTDSEKVKRLEDEVYDARWTILRLMPNELQDILRSYVRCATPDDTYRWKREVAAKIVALAKPPPVEHNAWGRALCPLCGESSMSTYSIGFTVPEGLRRHLLGLGTAVQCSVMAAACRLANDCWNSQVRPGQTVRRRHSTGSHKGRS